MKVWIDQDLCTGDGLCEEIAPAVFTLLDDGLAYVKEGSDVKSEPGGSSGMAAVPAHDQLSKRNQRGICSGGANDVKPAGGIFFGIGIGIGSGKAGIISLPP